jgi:hypothetical protein
MAADLKIVPTTALAAPPGWKLVPLEPTAQMLAAGQMAWVRDPLRKSSTLYRAMVEAAPHPAAGVGAVPPSPAMDPQRERELMVAVAQECGAFRFVWKVSGDPPSYTRFNDAQLAAFVARARAAGVPASETGHSEWHDLNSAADAVERVGKAGDWDESYCAKLSKWLRQLAALGVNVPAPMPFDRAAVFTIWQGMQYQGGITKEAQAMQFAQQVLSAHGVGVPSAADLEAELRKLPDLDQDDVDALMAMALAGIEHGQELRQRMERRGKRPICKYSDKVCQYEGASCTCCLPGFQGDAPTEWVALGVKTPFENGNG